MNKFKKKIFIIIFLILTFSILLFLFIFNIQNYIGQKNQIENNLNFEKDKNIMDNKENIPEKPNDIVFMDRKIYRIILENNKIKEVINLSNENYNYNEIKDITNKIINKERDNIRKVTNIYFNKYSYDYNKDNYILLIDNTNSKNILLNYLYISIILFIFIEIIIYIVSKSLTNYISKPIIDSFNNQKRFIFDASHELKTPLSVISSSLELYNKDNNKKWLNNISNETNRMNNLVNNLLELSKSEENNLYNFTNGNLSKTILLSILEFESVAFEKKIKIKYDIEEDIIFRYDENSIKELVEILLDNAIKHSYKNTTINIKLNKNNKNIILTISNKGDKINKEDENKIFERFYKIDKSRNRNNNSYGIGLSIAKNIVNNHNGTINAKTINNLTIFTIIFKI